MSRPADRPTASAAYTERLLNSGKVWWKRLLPVQAPYRWNLRRLDPGFMLDLGCGTGRNLSHVRGQGVGIDHNPDTVEVVRARGFCAFTPAEFAVSEHAGRQEFDSVLLSHVVEHMEPGEAASLIGEYLPLLRPGGRVILITPQEAGFRSDDTHVSFVDFEALRALARQLGLREIAAYSFPFPRVVGRVFRYNEFVWVGVPKDAPGE